MSIHQTSDFIKIGPQPQKFKLGYGDYLRFRDLVLERSGLYFPEKKRTDLENGVLKALSESSPVNAGSKHNLDSYYTLLRDKNNPAGRVELDRLIKTLTIGETYFFRDEAQFNALTSQVLPELIARKRAAAAAVGKGIQPQLRIWSAGCSSGEEPYSIAILLKELLPDIDNWHILLLATDINQDALARARQAVYSDWSFRETKARALRGSYFLREAANGSQSRQDRYRLRDDIRRMVTFASLNLIEDDYPAIHNNTVSMDLILCRNVTIYFTEATTKRVVQQFHQTLVDGGWLVVGHSEPSLVIYRNFETRSFKDTFFYQKTGRPARLPDDWEWPASDSQKNSLPDHRQDNKISADTYRNKPVTKSLTPWNLPATGGEMKSAGKTSEQPEAKIKEEPPAAAAPSPEATRGQAEELLSRGHTEEAITELQRLVAAHPTDAGAFSLLGRAYANQGHWSEAHLYCQKAVELDSLQAEAYYILASIYQHQDQIESAITMFKKAVYLDLQAPLPHLNLALLYQKTGRTEKARRSCRNVIQILEKWPPEKIVPDSGGATAQHLVIVARRILDQLG